MIKLILEGIGIIALGALGIIGAVASIVGVFACFGTIISFPIGLIALAVNGSSLVLGITLKCFIGMLLIIPGAVIMAILEEVEV